MSKLSNDPALDSLDDLDPRDTPVNGAALTIAQIAERAGVSIATVSKVVNGRVDVAPRTRAVVESVIRRYGYRRQKRSEKAIRSSPGARNC